MPATGAAARLKQARDWRAFKWLTIGIGIKRWGLLGLAGLVMTALGLLLALAYTAVDFSVSMVTWVNRATHRLVEVESLGWLMVGCGVVMFFVGLRGTLRAAEQALGTSKGGFLEAALRRHNLDSGEKLVALGGGNKRRIPHRSPSTRWVALCIVPPWQRLVSALP